MNQELPDVQTGFRKGRGRKEILKIKAEINAKETKETIAKINKAKSRFFERINKIELKDKGGSLVKKPLPKQETQETHVRSWDRKIPWRRKWQPTPVFLPRKSHGQRSLVDYSP